MVTTRRSSNSTGLSFERSGSSAGVDLLERTVAVSYDDYLVNVPDTTENTANEERMRQNLNDLLNYDRYSEVAEKPAEVQRVTASNDEDIRPTSTTMQFGSIGADEIHNEMRSHEEADTVRTLNGKGKLAIVLYSLIVTVIMALIVLNTGVLSGLNRAKDASAAALSEKAATYQEIQAENDYLGSADRIGDYAENVLGMTR